VGDRVARFSPNLEIVHLRLWGCA